jgi:ferrous-iron efflux pump FieF
MIAVWQALIPADKKHRFGHCKAEALGGFIQGVIIFLSACFLLVETVEHFISPEKLEKLDVGIGVMVISILVSVALIRFQKFVIRRTNSLSIMADNAHYTGDVMMNLGVIISMMASYLLGWVWLDTLFAAIVCVYLFFNSFHIIRGVSKVLMDEELPADERKKIKEIVMQNKNVQGICDLRTRNAGFKSFIQFTILLDENMTLTQAHKLCSLLEEEITNKIPKCEVFIHAEPKE